MTKPLAGTVKISGPAIVPFSRCVLFMIFLQTISGGDQFFCECYRGDFFGCDNIDRKPAHQNQTSEEQNRRPKQSGACSGYRSCRTPDDSPKRHSPLRDHNDHGVQASSRPSRYRTLRATQSSEADSVHPTPARAATTKNTSVWRT